MWQLGMGDDRARVAIVGCGGAGCNVLRRVAAPPGAVRIAMNDAPPPKLADVQIKIIVRAESLQAYASMDEKAVQQMETDEEKEISAALLDRDVVLVLGGLGGELGGWGMSLVGRVARILARVRDWRYGMGVGREKHRCFVAVDEAYASPWFTSVPEEIRHAIVLMSVLDPGTDEDEILRDIRRRSPNVDIAWATLPHA